MQRMNRVGYHRLALKLIRGARPETVGQDRRPHTYISRWDAAYRMPVADGDTRSGGWGRYLRQIANRPGWSVARLAREAKLNRTTVFDWIREGDGRSVTIGSVLAVAEAAGDHPLIALRAAADLEEAGDPEIEEILISDLPERIKLELLDMVERERVEARQQRMERYRHVIRLAGGEVA